VRRCSLTTTVPPADHPRMPTGLQPDRADRASANRRRARALGGVAVLAACAFAHGCTGVSSENAALERWGNERVAGLRRILDPTPKLSAIGRRAGRFADSTRRLRDLTVRRVGRVADSTREVVASVPVELARRADRFNGRVGEELQHELKSLGKLTSKSPTFWTKDDFDQLLGRRSRSIQNSLPRVLLLDHWLLTDRTDIQKFTGVGTPPRPASLWKRILDRLRL
jgi:hypothetical protein